MTEFLTNLLKIGELYNEILTFENVETDPRLIRRKLLELKKCVVNCRSCVEVTKPKTPSQKKNIPNTATENAEKDIENITEKTETDTLKTQEEVSKEILPQNKRKKRGDKGVETGTSKKKQV